MIQPAPSRGAWPPPFWRLRGDGGGDGHGRGPFIRPGQSRVRRDRLQERRSWSPTFYTYRGLKRGLIGTGLLKRFNVTIDVEAEVMRLYPLDRPELLVAGIDRGAVAADIPLYLFDATTVEASMAGSPPALHILDSAAGTNLVDRVFFEEHIKPKLDPARIVRSGPAGSSWKSGRLFGPRRVGRIGLGRLERFLAQ